MKSYCLKCRENTENINPKVSSKVMMLSKYAIWGSKKSIFIKNQEVKGRFSNLDLKTPLRKA